MGEGGATHGEGLWAKVGPAKGRSFSFSFFFFNFFSISFYIYTYI
jgi:hypothetical protein